MIGYIDPTTKKFVQSAGNLTTYNAPIADSSNDGIMSAEQAAKLDIAYTTKDKANTSDINSLFNK